MTGTATTRRTFLRDSGVAIALPFLHSLLPAAEVKKAAARPPRMLLIGRPLGFIAENFFPDQAGRDYAPSRYLKLLEPMREDFTVFSGMSHRYPVGHFASVGLFTGVPADWMRGVNDVKNGISLDQEVASHIGNQTRFASLVLGGGQLAWNRHGMKLPSEQHATNTFRSLFISGSADEQKRELQRIREGQSILDKVRGQIKSLGGRASTDDRDRLDLFVTAVREAEQRLQQDEHWSLTPKPRVDMRAPSTDLSPTALVERSRQWLDIVHLALQTDSTRSISLSLGLSTNAHPEIAGVTLGHHDASHHGQDPAKLAQLALIEDAEVKVFHEFLAKMKATMDGEHTLLDRTAVLYTSGLGNASSHDNRNLPVILAGGGFKHAGHVAYDRQNNKLMSNVYVRLLQHMGIEAEKFGGSDGVLSEV
jgi:Protein of unknown function (DUF1552)